MKIKAISPTVLSYARDKKWWERRDIEFLIDLEWWIRDKWRDLKNFLFGRYNMVKIESLDRTKYVDADTLLFEATFQILKDYVEIECAHMWNLFRNTRRGRRARDPEAGLAQLEWEIQQGDDSPEQSQYAKEFRDLYLWYTIERPRRQDPFDILPERVFEDEYEEMDDGFVRLHRKEISPEYRHLLQVAAKAEADQYEEDTQMIVRLAKVRAMLWT